MTRHPQWEPRLNALVSKHMATPYSWGQHDCMTWSADVAKAITGKDHGKRHRGKYDSFASAYAYLKRLGFDSPEAMLDSKFAEKPVGLAQRGDLVMGDNGIPLLCMGAYALSVGSEGNREGLVRIPRAQWVKAWAL